MKNQNTIGFLNKIKSLTNDDSLANQIVDLIPSGVILPLFYIGDEVYCESEDSRVIITDTQWKNYSYIYFFKNKSDDEVYSYEDDFTSK
jgi:hypothetical protein